MNYLLQPDNLGQGYEETWREDAEREREIYGIQPLPTVSLTAYQMQRCMSPELSGRVMEMLYPGKGKPRPVIDGDATEHDRLQGPDHGKQQRPR